MIVHTGLSVYTVEAGTCRMHIRRHLGFEKGSWTQNQGVLSTTVACNGAPRHSTMKSRAVT